MTSDRHRLPALLCCLIGLSSCAPSSNQASRPDGTAAAAGAHAELVRLVASERAFARAAGALGIRGAFLAYLAEDAVLFRPRAVNGVEWYRDQPDGSGLLSWFPTIAEIAAAGDMGYTSGPWEYRRSADDTLVAHGQYLSVWKRQPDAIWKVAIDIGTTNPPPSDEVPAFRTSLNGGDTGDASAAEVDVAFELDALLELDWELPRAAASTGPGESFSASVSDEILLLRASRGPTTGLEAARRLLSERPGTVMREPLGGRVSRSGDLGYTYGAYEFRGSASPRAEEGNYVRVWRRQPGESWKLVADVMSPIPAPSAN